MTQEEQNYLGISIVVEKEYAIPAFFKEAVEVESQAWDNHYCHIINNIYK